jgi:hypothetical protein
VRVGIRYVPACFPNLARDPIAEDVRRTADNLLAEGGLQRLSRRHPVKASITRGPTDGRVLLKRTAR